jgi:hypothetical protein
MSGAQSGFTNFGVSRMDDRKRFSVEPLPLEKEFKISSVKQRLKELTREDLELFLGEALETMTKLAHQVTQLRDYIEELEGKTD